MEEFEAYLKKAGDYHGHVCSGIALGTKMTLAAMKALGLNPQTKNKNLIVYAEIDRCMTDAVQSITGCTLGHRSLKHIDYGKFAASFVNTDTGKAVRTTIRESFDSHGPVDEVIKKIMQVPDADLVIMEEVEISIPETDLPGHPHKRAYCSVCGERVMDGRDIERDGKIYCRACAGGPYYKVIRK